MLDCRKDLLEGLQVLDLTRLLPGPLCTMILGDYGAAVLKIEDPFTGDPTRAVGETADGSGSFFRLLNRNKKSMALNLKSARGEIMHGLVKSDLLVEGFRPGVMKRLGMSFAELSALNPSLIYASITGWARRGLPGAGGA